MSWSCSAFAPFSNPFRSRLAPTCAGRQRSDQVCIVRCQHHVVSLRPFHQLSVLENAHPKSHLCLDSSPGLTSKGGRAPDGIAAQQPVAIQAEGKEHACAVGFTKMSTADIKSINKGIGIDNIHVSSVLFTNSPPVPDQHSASVPRRRFVELRQIRVLEEEEWTVFGFFPLGPCFVRVRHWLEIRRALSPNVSEFARSPLSHQERTHVSDDCSNTVAIHGVLFTNSESLSLQSACAWLQFHAHGSLRYSLAHAAVQADTAGVTSTLPPAY